ncbi:hypothetical protein [Falsibacillus pallidus]|uniref:hypothetical protein n=1 Tax=Falsibacillus pallidus TaxID=493781 RepID=UPI003D970F94
MLLLVCLLLILVIIVLRKKIPNYPFVVSGLILFFLLLILIGHTEANFKFQAKSDLENLKENTQLNFDSDKLAKEKIVDSKHPLAIKTLVINSDYGDKTNPVKRVLVRINHTEYKATFISHNSPLPFSPFEKWDMNQIETIK